MGSQQIPTHSKTNQHNLYVRNLPRYYTQKQLEDLFKPFGTISAAKINDAGVAFVRFVDANHALSAIKNLHGTKPNGFDREIIVKLAHFDIGDIRNRWNGKSNAAKPKQTATASPSNKNNNNNKQSLLSQPSISETSQVQNVNMLNYLNMNNMMNMNNYLIPNVSIPTNLQNVSNVTPIQIQQNTVTPIQSQINQIQPNQINQAPLTIPINLLQTPLNYQYPTITTTAPGMGYFVPSNLNPLSVPTALPLNTVNTVQTALPLNNSLNVHNMHVAPPSVPKTTATTTNSNKSQ